MKFFRPEMPVKASMSLQDIGSINNVKNICLKYAINTRTNTIIILVLTRKLVLLTLSTSVDSIDYYRTYSIIVSYTRYSAVLIDTINIISYQSVLYRVILCHIVSPGINAGVVER